MVRRLLFFWALFAPAISFAQAPIYIPNIVGPTGPEGAPGATGANGTDGTPGMDGAPGADGADTTPLLVSLSPSGDASVSITNFASSDFIKYRIEYWLTLSADDQELYVHTDSDGGASYDSSAASYQFANRTVDTSAETTNLSSSATAISLVEDAAGGAIGNASGESVSGSIIIEHLGSASTQPILTFRTAYVSANGSISLTEGAGTRLANAAIDAIEFDPEGATTVTGEVRVYGIRNAN